MHLEMGLSVFQALVSTLCCDEPQEGDATQHGSAVLVIYCVVLVGEGEEQLAARTIIAASMEKQALSQRTLFLSEKQCTSPRKPTSPGLHLLLANVPFFPCSFKDC